MDMTNTNIQAIFDGFQAFTNNTTAFIIYTAPIALMLVLIVIVRFYSKRKQHNLSKIMQSIEDKDPKHQSLKSKKDPSETIPEDTPSADVLPSEKHVKVPEILAIQELSESSWLMKLRKSLHSSKERLSYQIHSLLKDSSLSEEMLEEIRKILYQADLGVETTEHLIDYIKKQKKLSSQEITYADITHHLTQCMLSLMTISHHKEHIPTSGPRVILIVGVNGVGKTTTTGKLAAHFCAAGKQVLLCAADTFRAGAINQLSIWGERLQIDVIKNQPKTDPAAVVYNATEAAIARKSDVLLIDTAGRLHNRKELMDQLLKIQRIIKKHIPVAPHEIWQVIDATTGSNAIKQVQAFKKILPLTGLIITKLDGTAKGGSLVGITHSEQLHIKYIGLGEKAADLRRFEAKAFVQALLDVNEDNSKNPQT